jgi:hypothetical protein
VGHGIWCRPAARCTSKSEPGTHTGSTPADQPRKKTGALRRPEIIAVNEALSKLRQLGADRDFITPAPSILLDQMTATI